MAQALILDSEALNALAHARQRPALAERAHAVLFVANEENADIRIPSAVLAEVCRSAALDAAVQRVVSIKGVAVVDLTAAISRHAGRLLARAKLGSAHAVDAFVVATAARYGSAVIATHDPDDIARLAVGLRGVRILAI